MESPLEFRFKPEKSDYVQASRALANKTPMFIVLAVVTLIIMIGSVIVLVVPTVGNPTWNSVAIVSLIVGAFYLVYYFLLIPLQLGGTYKKNEYLQKERVMTISDENITMKVADRRSELAWDNFEKVLDCKNLYLMIYKADQRVYPFIPKRAFTEPGSEDAFRKSFVDHDIPIK
jgi:hypothetical protein